MRAVTAAEVEWIVGGLTKKISGDTRALFKKSSGHIGTNVEPPVNVIGTPPTSGYGDTWGPGDPGGGGTGGGGSTGGGGNDGGGGTGTGGPEVIGTNYTTHDGRHVTIGYENTTDGVSSDQPVSPAMYTEVHELLGTDTSVTSIDVSATTNGQHTPGSDHASGNAIDINKINGVHVSATGEGYALAQELENAAKINPLVRYVEGPAGDFARSSPYSPWVRAPNESTMNSHVHVSVFKSN